ncbi:hypothetical protein Nepgr_010342 [Nepenthes gracilis]|uniref:Uncharacterized protein n=1 Tax=Nepenthes gracilis TaxID=150966 RepID=A0AAD3XKZ6_NEPGR|nr:hypothetical protein Nepgr_010342 [Nepenthes gracilis]
MLDWGCTTSINTAVLGTGRRFTVSLPVASAAADDDSCLLCEISPSEILILLQHSSIYMMAWNHAYLKNIWFFWKPKLLSYLLPSQIDDNVVESIISLLLI